MCMTMSDSRISTPCFRVLHTSDLHLGKRLYHYPRLDEQRSVLERICMIASEKRVDAVVISGDVFDTAQPGAEAVRLFASMLSDLTRRLPGVTVVATGGNHDSPSRINQMAPVCECIGVHLVGGLEPGVDPLRDFIVEVPGKGWIVAVPYINEAMLPEDLYDTLLEEVERRNAALGLPVVLMAHTAVTGCRFRGHENATERYIGGIDAVSVETLGRGYDYLALGHIHMPHALRGTEGRARYSGTPLAVNFDEDYAHSVSVVTMRADGSAPEIEEVEIVPERPLVNIPSEGFARWEDALRGVLAHDKGLDCYLRVNVEAGDDVPEDADAQVRSVLEGGKTRFCLVNYRRREAEATPGRRVLTVGEFREKGPLEIAELYVEGSGEMGKFTDEMKEILANLIKEVEHETE